MRRSYVTVPVLMLILAGILSGCAATAAAASRGAATPKASTKASAKASTKAAAKTGDRETAQSAAARQLAATAQLDLTTTLLPLARTDDGHFAVAVDDLTTGADASYAGTDQFVTASIVKVDILATLLYQQQAGQTLTAGEQSLSVTMIENSDNDSASDLYADAGGAQGVDEANNSFGLQDTTAGTDGYWGLTTTTADDQIQLLRLVFAGSSALTATSQDYIRDLMSDVETDQQWGVPAAADSGSDFMVKNGWLPNPTLWEINSIGEITHDHQLMLIAVLSDDNTSEDSGISLIEDAAEKAADSMADSSR